MCKKLTYLVSFAFGLALILPGVGNAAADPNLVACWRFDGNLLDSAGNGRDGTPHGNPQYGAGVYGEALELDGDDYVTIDGYKGVLGTHAFSITAWIKTTNTAIEQIVHWGTHTDGQRVEFRINNNRLRISHGGGNVQGDTTLTDGQWHHVAVTVIDSATASSGDVTFYVDGQDDTRASSDPAGWDIVANATLDLTIGWRPTQQDRPFIGSMDDVTIYNKVLTPEEVVAIMNGEIKLPQPALASDPSPAHEEPDAPRDAVLSWTPGDYVAGLSPKHRVLFSERLDDVIGGVGGVTQDPNTYAPGILDFDKTYYWRVDEANSVSGWDQGDIWQFTVEPFAYPIASDNIKATASSVHEVDTGPENTINGSGLDADDLHSTEESGMWLSSRTGPQPTWIQYEFDKIYKLHEMWVWNHNSSFESAIGFGFRDVVIEYSTNGADWTQLDGVPEFARAAGAAGYAHDTTVDFKGVGAKYVKITANSNWGGFLAQYGLSEVRFLYIPVQARGPRPDTGATDLGLDLTLSWRPGREAARHDVYFSTSKKEVAKGTADVTTVTDASHGPLALDLGETYYWRVDEVNDVESPNVWEGDLWSFTTYEYFLVDDFETYDANENQIWYVWRDGLGFGAVDSPPYNPGNGTGAAVGDETTGSYTEETIIHGGGHSMPYAYNNTGSTGKFNYSEAAMTLTSGRDWTRRGVKALTLWFRGYPESASTLTEGPPGTYTMTARSDNIGGVSDELHFVYKQLSGPGSIIAKVESITNTSASAKAGVMIRETLDPDSKHALASMRPDGGVRFHRRLDLAADTTSSVEDGLAFPQWVRLERDASGLFTASHSADGVNWVPVDDLNMGTSDTVQMNTVVYVGLALSSNNTGATCEAVFSDVQVTGQVTGQWQSRDVGIFSNNPTPMYVAVANSNGTTGVVYHDDPNATQIETWTEWNIDLKDLANQGVNLNDVNSIALGFGDRNNPQPGGSGTMYFDDIRLYPPRCIASLLKPAGDFSDNCVVDMPDLEIMSDNWLIGDYDVTAVAPGTANLVLHYEFENNTNDSSGSGNHGDPNGGVSYVAGKVGQAIHLDGIDDYVAIQNLNYARTGYTAWTVCSWIRTSSNLMQAIASFDRSEYWRLEVGPSAYADVGQLGWEVDVSPDGQVDLLSTMLVNDGQWHHVAGVFDSGQMILYIDGKIDALASGGSTSGTGTTRYGFIGSQSEAAVFDGNRSGTPGPFDGDLDDVRIYERALSQAEIANLAGVPAGGTLRQPLQPLLSTTADVDLHDDETIDFKDFAVLIDSWLDEQLWPQP